MDIWLVGAGPMAEDYSNVLISQGLDFKVICRSKSSAENFFKKTNISAISGGVHQACKKIGPPDVAIVAVGVYELEKTARTLIHAGTKRLLLEKPGGLNLKEISSLNSFAKINDANVLLGYNRRFYSSVIKAGERIKEDGGLLSTRFEFTEWSHVIENLDIKPEVKKSWLLANSSHVIDLAFYFSGKPIEISPIFSGKLHWHPASSRFSGSGLTDKNVLFSYFADWESSGRWSLELLTKKNRIILSPLETMQMIKKGSTKIEKIDLSDELDTLFKPGLYRQIKEFVAGNDEKFCKLEEQVANAELYKKIAGYK